MPKVKIACSFHCQAKVDSSSKTTSVPPNINVSDLSDGIWRCPAGCNERYDRIPREYRCFCRKVKEPEFNIRELPHSCGEVCNRAREQCSHRCVELCHPGPCPECTANTKKYVPLSISLKDAPVYFFQITLTESCALRENLMLTGLVSVEKLRKSASAAHPSSARRIVTGC